MAADTMTPEQHREAANALDARAEESFQRCDTDGFLSQWAAGISAQKHRLAAQVAEAGGVWSFPALFDVETGERVPAKLIDGRYGTCWALVDEDGRFTGQFIKAFPAREATMAKKGFREGREMAPAMAKIEGRGTGLSGSAWAAIVRTDDGTGRDPRCVPVAVEDEDNDSEGEG